MALAEFELIRRYLLSQASKNPSTVLGIGDDCALLSIPSGFQLAVTTDTMVENVHFFAGADPEALGHKLLAVNLSDLAAMGAQPLSVTLSLTLPRADESWLAAFTRGFFTLAKRYNIDLIGGDTTSGPLSLTVQALGLVPEGKALKRSTAQAGDHIYMTGCLGDAGLGLKIMQGYPNIQAEQALQRFHLPDPRVDAGLVLRDVASACIDLSDGLAGDLLHVLEQSGVGACLNWHNLPLSAGVQSYLELTGDWLMPLTAGDDYELCFTAPPGRVFALPVEFSLIGVVEQEPGLRLQRFGRIEDIKVTGFEHFS